MIIYCNYVEGFGPSTFSPAINPNTSKPYTYANDGFEATSYNLSTDQFGSQLDPPAHWNPYYPSIAELPPTFCLRPLVVISIVPQVQNFIGYQMQVDDIVTWEKRNGIIPRCNHDIECLLFFIMICSILAEELSYSYGQISLNFGGKNNQSFQIYFLSLELRWMP